MAAKKKNARMSVAMTPAVQRDYGKGLKAMKKHVRTAKSRDEALLRYLDIVGEVVKELQRAMAHWRIKSLALVFCIVSAAMPARAQKPKAEAPDSMTISEGSFSAQAFKAKGTKELTSRYIFDGYEYLGGQRCGGWMFVDGEKRYLSFALGPFCDVGLLEVSVGGGVETLGESKAATSTVYMRGASALRFGTEDLYAEVYYEKGNRKSEDWFQMELAAPSLSIFNLGVYGQSGSGFGPRLRLEIPFWDHGSGEVWKFRIWAAPMFSFDKPALRRPQGLLLGGEFVGSLKELIK